MSNSLRRKRHEQRSCSTIRSSKAWKSLLRRSGPSAGVGAVAVVAGVAGAGEAAEATVEATAAGFAGATAEDIAVDTVAVGGLRRIRGFVA